MAMAEGAKRKKCKTCRQFNSSDDSESEHERCPPNELFDKNDERVTAFYEMIKKFQDEGILPRNGIQLKRLLRGGLGKYLVPTYDEAIHKHFSDHANHARVAKELTRMKEEAIDDFINYPRDNYAPLQFWEEFFPVYDLAMYRTAHFYDKYQRMPSSLFWTNFEHQELIDRLNPSSLTNDKYENVDVLLQDLMDLDLRVHEPQQYRKDLENQKLRNVMRDVLEDD